MSHSRNWAFGTPTRSVDPSWDRKLVGRNHVAKLWRFTLPSTRARTSSHRSSDIAPLSRAASG